MNTKVKEIHPVDDAKVADETTEAKLITEDEFKKFRQAFGNVVSDRALGRENEYQAMKKYNSYLECIQEEIKKVDDPVIVALFDLQADIYKAIHMPPPPR